MKKLILLFQLCCLGGFCIAQTALPYYTGFETAAEKAGWTQFAKGNMTSKPWTLGPYPSLSGSATLLVSPNAEFNSSAMTDTINQWYVSPGFNFSAGGKIDSFSIAVFGASGSAQPTDSIVLYLLQGSNNPSLATSRVRLANLTTMVKGFGLSMKDTGNFVIPPTSGTSYVAFKYYGIYDWFQVYIDSIYISGNPVTHNNNLSAVEESFSIYPNPANTEISIAAGGHQPGITSISILDVAGHCVLNEDCLPPGQDVRIDISRLPAGLYTVAIAGTEVMVSRKLLISR